MASNINMVVIEGNLGKDAEIRFTGNNKAIASFSVAVNESYKDPNGNWQDSTSWIEVVKWTPSDYLKENLIKGQSVTISGKLRQDTWTDNNNKSHSRTYVIAEKISLHKKVNSQSTDSNDDTDDGMPF